MARYLRRITRRGDPKRKWVAFLRNHREVLAAMDFFTVPTVAFRVLYCFFVIEYKRRKILHCNVNQFPTAEWIVQQLREAFPDRLIGDTVSIRVEDRGRLSGIPMSPVSATPVVMKPKREPAQPNLPNVECSLTLDQF